MATSKTATLTLRIEPEIKQALQRAAELEHRSIANMVVSRRAICLSLSRWLPSSLR